MQQPGGGAGSQYQMSPDMAHMLGIPAAAENFQQPTQPQLVIQQKPVEPEAASPISSRPPPARNFEELVPAAGGGFPDEEALAGEEAERGPPGNRWPRQETVALLKIRSDMDAAFRDATLKGPLWEEVSRKLGELGYQRSAKKCKEKFENVHKYYKRTKGGRAGRQDGKSYRFFSQLEALHSRGEAPNVTPVSATPISVGNPMAERTQAVASLPPPPPPPPVSSAFPSGSAAGQGISGGINFSSSSSEEEESEEEMMEEGRPGEVTRKRKRSGSGSGGGSSSKKMMAFFEGMIRQVMERQEAMQQRFLETIEKREQDRMIREEAWKRQEMAQLNREHELMAQERAMAASRDAAVIGFFQNITGQTIQIPASTTSAAANIVSIPTALPPASHPAPPVAQAYHTLHQQQHPPQKPQQRIQSHAASSGERRHRPATSTAEAAVVAILDHHNQPDLTSSRWPKSEVHALIKLRSDLESRYQESGPKGQLWEEISAGMKRMGHQRSSKRCKEKWENINKYFKKVKESNKKRPEDAKTCPYFHQLDALYKKKMVGTSSNSGSTPADGQIREDQGGMDQNASAPIVPASMPQSQSDQSQAKDNKNNNNGGGNDGSNNGGSNLEEQTSNGGLPSSFFDQGAIKKPEDIMKELMMEHQQQSVMDDYEKLGEPDSDNLEQDVDDEDEDDEDDDEDAKMDFKIQYQRPGPGSSNGGGNVSKSTAATAGSFLALVQ